MAFNKEIDELEWVDDDLVEIAVNLNTISSVEKLEENDLSINVSRSHMGD